MKQEKRGVSRREALEAISAAMGMAVAAACGGSPTSPTTTSATSPGTTTTTTGGGITTSGSCVVTPEETAGPYPDRLGMISNPTYYRRDVTEGKSGLPVMLVLTVVNVRNSCSPVANAVVEIWQCDASGNYSEYSQPGFNGTGQTFLRGLQTTDANGAATFQTIYPGWYQGRATHIHVEVFVNAALVKTTQIAFPESESAAVYSTGVYASRGRNPTSNASDNVFSDGTQYELATLSGSATSGYTAALTIGVSV
jgi:protocatechuate 3,4-dioxygenase beta subunit